MQMISPGCSFTFDGLKQTLRAHGYESSELRQVEHLLINYRTTKDILMLGNSVLSTARTYFPGAIDFARLCQTGARQKRSWIESCYNQLECCVQVKSEVW